MTSVTVDVSLSANACACTSSVGPSSPADVTVRADSQVHRARLEQPSHVHSACRPRRELAVQLHRRRPTQGPRRACEAPVSTLSTSRVGVVIVAPPHFRFMLPLCRTPPTFPEDSAAHRAPHRDTPGHSLGVSSLSLSRRPEGVPWRKTAALCCCRCLTTHLTTDPKSGGDLRWSQGDSNP